MKIPKNVAAALLLAHHPICTPFQRDMIGKKRPICKGCTFFYFSLIIGLILGIFLYRVSFINSSANWNLILTVVALSLIATYVVKLAAGSDLKWLTKIKNSVRNKMGKYNVFLTLTEIPQWLDNLIHVTSGLGVGLLWISVIKAPIGIIWKILLLSQVHLSFALTFFPRLKKMDEICASCPFISKKPNCPGFTKTHLD